MYLATEPKISSDLKTLIEIIASIVGFLLIAVFLWLSYRLRLHHRQPKEIVSTCPDEALEGRTLANSSSKAPVWPETTRFSGYLRHAAYKQALSLSSARTNTPPLPPPLPRVVPGRNQDGHSSVSGSGGRDDVSRNASESVPSQGSSVADSGFTIDHEPIQLPGEAFNEDTFWCDCETHRNDGSAHSTLPGLAY